MLLALVIETGLTKEMLYSVLENLKQVWNQHGVTTEIVTERCQAPKQNLY